MTDEAGYGTVKLARGEVAPPPWWLKAGRVLAAVAAFGIATPSTRPALSREVRQSLINTLHIPNKVDDCGYPLLPPVWISRDGGLFTR